MHNKLGQVILTPGFEAGSDYCEGCEKVDQVAFCLQYKEELDSNYKHQPVGNYFNPEIVCTRCDSCKEGEQAAKQGIPREEVEPILRIAKELRLEDEGQWHVGSAMSNTIFRLESLLNKPKETK